MSRLAELSDYKNTIATKITESMDLCKAIKYGETDFLEQPDIDDRTTLFYDNIYPYRFIPDTTTSMKTFITLSFRKFGLVNNGFKKGYIYINVFTHRDLFKTDYGCTRVDYILNKIDELLNQQRGIGIGKLEFYDMDEISVNNMFQGNYICYKPVEFN